MKEEQKQEIRGYWRDMDRLHGDIESSADWWLTLLDSELNKQREEILKLRNELYDLMPSGNIDAFHLVTLLGHHIEKLDAFITPKT